MAIRIQADEQSMRDIENARAAIEAGTGVEVSRGAVLAAFLGSSPLNIRGDVKAEDANFETNDLDVKNLAHGVGAAKGVKLSLSGEAMHLQRPVNGRPSAEARKKAADEAWADKTSA